MPTKRYDFTVFYMFVYWYVFIIYFYRKPRMRKTWCGLCMTDIELSNDCCLGNPCRYVSIATIVNNASKQRYFTDLHIVIVKQYWMCLLIKCCVRKSRIHVLEYRRYLYHFRIVELQKSRVQKKKRLVKRSVCLLYWRLYVTRSFLFNTTF